jgi:hypothetical protein
VRAFLCSSSEQRRLSAGALRSRESLTLAAMVRAFDDAVARTLGDREVSMLQEGPRW